MKKFNKFVALRVITVMAIVMLPFLGSDCNEILNQNNPQPCTGGDITGNWTLIYNSGTLLDICPGETVNFPNNSGGTATLTCPNQSGIQRTYTVSGQTLTYTETSIQYQVCFDNSGNLVLNGIGNDRVLYYSTSIGSNKHEGNNKNIINYNSSEITK